MNGLLYYKHVYLLNNIEQNPSECVDGGNCQMEDVVFHNEKVFKHFFAKGR